MAVSPARRQELEDSLAHLLKEGVAADARPYDRIQWLSQQMQNYVGCFSGISEALTLSPGAAVDNVLFTVVEVAADALNGALAESTAPPLILESWARFSRTLVELRERPSRTNIAQMKVAWDEWQSFLSATEW